VVTKKPNVEHYTFDDVLDNKCENTTANNDYKWGGGVCVKSAEQCIAEQTTTCYNTDGTSTQQNKVQDDIGGGCKAPERCVESLCNPENCDTIDCTTTNNGLCTKGTFTNPPDRCSEVCPHYSECLVDEDVVYKWKISDGKWKKYETKMNYDTNGDCVRKYFDGSEWKKIDNNFIDNIVDENIYCTINNITIANENQFEKINNKIVCSNNPSIEWNVIQHLTTNEFNNRLQSSDNANNIIDLVHNTNSTCSLELEPINHSTFCPEPEPEPEDTYTRIDNCKTADGTNIYRKNNDQNFYISNDDMNYEQIESDCYYECPTINSDTSPYTYTTTYETTSCIDTTIQCSNVCKDDTSGPYYELNENTCTCKPANILTRNDSNCYRLPDYSNYNNYSYCMSNDKLYEYVGGTCSSSDEIVCFSKLVDSNNTPGFTQLEGDSNCYKLSDETQGEYYFKFTQGGRTCLEGGCVTSQNSIELDQTCAPAETATNNQPTNPTISLVGQTNDSITVNISELDYGDYANDATTKTRILYKKYRQGGIMIGFDELAITEYSNSVSIPESVLVRKGNPDRGYIELQNISEPEPEITIPRLASHTKYLVSVAIIYNDSVSTQSVKTSYSVFGSTKIMPDKPTSIVGQTHNSIRVRVPELKYGDYANEATTKTRILYKKTNYTHDIDSNFNELATTTKFTNTLSIPESDLERKGNRDRGYIELTDTSNETDITIPNLDYNTPYIICVSIVYDSSPSQTILSDEIEETTNKNPPTHPTISLVGQTNDSITVNISELDYGDYANDATTKTRILYKKSDYKHISIFSLSNFHNLAITASPTNTNRGYIELTDTSTDITIPDLSSNTEYIICVSIVYDSNPSKIILSDEIEETTLGTPQQLDIPALSFSPPSSFSPALSFSPSSSFSPPSSFSPALSFSPSSSFSPPSSFNSLF
jgi:hypothetical protein